MLVLQHQAISEKEAVLQLHPAGDSIKSPVLKRK